MIGKRWGIIYKITDFTLKILAFFSSFVVQYLQSTFLIKKADEFDFFV